jgi:hypothetical protein
MPRQASLSAFCSMKLLNQGDTGYPSYHGFRFLQILPASFDKAFFSSYHIVNLIYPFLSQYTKRKQMLEKSKSAGPPQILFDDEDVKDPTHDKMMLWLDAHLEDLLNQSIYPDMTQEQVDNFLENKAEIQKSWQQPVLSSSGGIVGFVDMIVSYNRADVSDQISKVFFLDVRTDIISLGQLIREVKAYKHYLGVEESWMYSYVVVCPDAQYSQVLGSQGIELWLYNPNSPHASSEPGSATP